MNLFSRKTKTEGDGDVTVVLHVDGMHCPSCGLLIDDELEEIPGVRSASTAVRTGRSTIRLEAGVDVDPAVLVAAVEGAGDYAARLAH